MKIHLSPIDNSLDFATFDLEEAIEMYKLRTHNSIAMCEYSAEIIGLNYMY